ncbi:Transposase DDE domain protein (plasmid) [Streptomyces sp. YIM 121038]|uniref:transposase n=1 Tax=Streptomyces sp. YIM 121038 TaxID=2136401 RepID=UPI001164B6ED|nr:transposase [Streptomyces sp. YIM 121038]QCX82455.1 Transposase DDE domain protein [Streptomyces sp. YIM 121038]
MLADSVAWRDTPGAFWRGLRTVALDGTTLQVPDAPANKATFGTRKAKGGGENGYPLLRLLVLVETGTRAVLGAVFGPFCEGETAYASSLFGHLRAGMLLLADRGFDGWELMKAIQAEGADFLIRSRLARTPLVLRRGYVGLPKTSTNASARNLHSHAPAARRVLPVRLRLRPPAGQDRRGEHHRGAFPLE